MVGTNGQWEQTEILLRFYSNIFFFCDKKQYLQGISKVLWGLQIQSPVTHCLTPHLLKYETGRMQLELELKPEVQGEPLGENLKYSVNHKGTWLVLAKQFVSNVAILE